VATFDVRDGLITCLQADPVIEIADQILERADPTFLSVGDGSVTFHCSNGDISYGLRDHDDIRETWIGIRPGVDDDE
jgi:hypothetical protein